jgi:hypothetical protein
MISQNGAGEAGGGDAAYCMGVGVGGGFGEGVLQNGPPVQL